MQTPSLRRRVIVINTVVLMVLLFTLNGFLYLTLRSQLETALDGVLDARSDTAIGLAGELPPREVARRLGELGVPARVRTPTGEQFTTVPAVPRIGEYVPPTERLRPWLPRTAALPDGGTVTVFASRTGVDRTLRELLILELIGSSVATALAILLLSRGTRRALRPLQQVVDTADRTATGTSGLRLRPDRPETELGRMASAYDRVLDALEAAAEQARRSDERSQRFLADAAHQLRTPITRIRATVESLFRAQSPEARDRLLATLVRETGRTGKLLSGLLRMARLDQGDQPVPAPVDVVALCRAEMERVEPFAPHLRFELRQEGPVTLNVDAEAIREAVSNMLDNARRHAVGEIVVDIRTTEGTVRISVADDGPGVAAADQERIFERFASLDDKGGSGLGLPIARGVARAHEGDLTYTDRAFVLSLPLTLTAA